MSRSQKWRGLMTVLVVTSILGFCLGFGMLMTGCAETPKIEVKTVYVPVKAPMPEGIKEPCVIPAPPPVDPPAKGFDLVAWIGQVLVEFMDCDGKRAAAVVIHEGEARQ